MRRLACFLACCGFLAAACAQTATTGATGEGDLEISVCSPFEPVVFWGWRQAAGEPDPARVRHLPYVDAVSVRATDGRILRGYRIRHGGSPSLMAEGYVLVALGNAMLADRLVAPMTFLRHHGFDVYIFDHRGYGRSDGKARLKAMARDYRKIISWLNAKGYGRRALYGMSFGGIVLLDAIGAGAAFDAAVIDSAPSRVSDRGCPDSYNPVNNLPADSSRIMIVAGGKDTVVKPTDIAALVEQARRRGANVIEERSFAHPFQDRDPTVHQKRMTIIRDFLVGTSR